MVEIASRLDLYQRGRDYVIARATRIDPSQIDVEGSDVNVFVGSASFMADAVSSQLVDRTSALFLDGAEFEDLDRLAFDRYQLTRKGASPAVGTIRIFRATAAAGAGAINIGTKVVSLTGIEYILTSSAIFAAATLSTTATVRAVDAGKETQVGANQIRRFSAAPFDTTLQINNDEPTAGGEDVQTDDQFRELVRDFWVSARRGTLGAIEFGARTVAGIDSAQAFEEITGFEIVDILNPTTGQFSRITLSNNQPARVVSLFVADSSGVSNTALVAIVGQALSEFRAGGIQVIVNTSSPQIVPIQLQLAFRGPVDTAILAENVRDAVISYVNSLPVNATLYRAALFSVLQRYSDDGLVVATNSIAIPTGDVTPVIGFTIRVRDSDVTLI